MNKQERSASVCRTTKETEITVSLALDGSGKAQATSGIGFLDHMLDTLARHSGFDLTVTCRGDLGVDGHHTVEDIGICLGQALRKCIGDGTGIARYGSAIIPMDEALAQVVVDLCGRSFLAHNLKFPQERVGDFDSCLVEEFLRAYAVNAGITVHVRQLAGFNSHHLIEACFKALAHALNQAVIVVDQDILSTKGTLF
ncbi:MAG TPA: imidazoleglycerol-phosphate dehydratase HisB [Limnochordia bacterium]|nr:imidazoleglycerol-phosphate dehydratase HisB [Bacillota bacterium]HKM18158.1 imidazoleglycerol-phosphate dehydratase HisB [Limnochordia bacterium]